ncbi:MAG TPA: tetratricopeptide repeat protein [Crenotrichaceae bacterium]|nr:tetratricopeptide repeat protein [Crenotrichaceae bacterium]
MKKLTIIVIALILAGFASYHLAEYLTSESDKGQVIVGISNYTLETTFYVFALFLGLAFILFYLLVRMLILLWKSPTIIKKKSLTKKQLLAQNALVTSLVDSAEGNWEKAENTLIKHAANSAAPLIHFLTAARTAHSRGATDKRDEYLKQAYDSTPDSDITVGITKAELHLSGEEYDQALDTLKRLDLISPGHAVVQSLLHKTYEKLNDWDAVHNLLPGLKKNKTIMDLDIHATEVTAYSERLKLSVASNDIDQLKELWNSIPDRIKRDPEVCSVYFAGMIESNQGREIEKELYKILSKNWNKTLLVLFGSIESSEPEKQLKQTEKFLKKHADDAILYRVLGKLCMRQNKPEEAIAYLKQSINLEPSVTAYQLLGDLLSQQQGQIESANKYYRKGLLLASDEIVRETQDENIVDEKPPEHSPVIQQQQEETMT